MIDRQDGRWRVLSVLMVVLLLLTRGIGLGDALTLGEALSLASERNVQLQRVREERQAARGQVIEARSAALPQVKLRGSYVRLDEAPTMNMGGQAMPMGREDNYEALAEVSQLLYAGGGVSAALRLAKAHEESVRSQADFAASEVALLVHRLFHAVLLAREQVATEEEALAFARQNAHDVKARAAQGVALAFDVLRAEEQISRGEANLIRAKNALHTTRLALWRVLGLGQDDTREVHGELAVIAGEMPTPEEAVAEALESRQDYQAVRRQVEMMREAVTVARSGWRPTVAVFGQAKYANPTRRFEEEWEDSWMAGIRAEWALFDGQLTRGAVTTREARLRQAELQRDDLAEQIHLDVVTALADLEAAGRVTEATGRTMASAEEALRLAQRGYAEGTVPQLDVLNAQWTRTASRLQHAEAIYQHTVALRTLDWAMGKTGKGVE